MKEENCLICGDPLEEHDLENCNGDCIGVEKTMGDPR